MKNCSSTSPPTGVCNIIIAVITLTLLSLPGIALAGDGFASWRLDVGVSSVYDNNILRYSDKYISRFDVREDEGRFHINTRDDLIIMNLVRASVSMDLIGSLTTTGAVDYRRRTYTHNSVKDWSYLSFSLRQDLSKKMAAQIAYNYIPGFYVRHYRDDEWVKEFGYTPETFQPFDFTKDELAGWVQYALFPGTRVRGQIAFMRYFYNEHFTEYDSRNTLFGIKVYQTLSKTVRVNGGFEAVHSDAAGNAEKDPTFDENGFTFGIDFQLPKVFGCSNGIGVDGEHVRRFYSSTLFLEIDPEHAGRQDYEYNVAATYSFDILDDLELALSYAWRSRKTETSAAQNAAYLSDEKDYSQYQIEFEARYTFNFLR